MHGAEVCARPSERGSWSQVSVRTPHVNLGESYHNKCEVWILMSDECDLIADWPTDPADGEDLHGHTSPR